jgi:hypothetical protein
MSKILKGHAPMMLYLLVVECEHGNKIIFNMRETHMENTSIQQSGDLSRF